MGVETTKETVTSGEPDREAIMMDTMIHIEKELMVRATDSEPEKKAAGSKSLMKAAEGSESNEGAQLANQTMKLQLTMEPEEL